MIINGFTSRKTLKILKALKTTIRARGSTRRRFFKIMKQKTSQVLTGRQPQCAVGDARRPQFRTGCGALPYLTDGVLSFGVRTGPPQPGDGADPVWFAPTRLSPGR